MIIEIKVPQLPESVSEATLLGWKKKVGEAIARDENLIDIETDKVVLEIPAPQAGVVVSIVKQEGDSVVSDEVIATIDTDAKVGAGAPAAAPAPAAATPSQEVQRVEAAAKAAGVEASAVGYGTAV
ncbi:biotin/lipoyl-containing protein, partial [Chitiniphilus eburneus]